MRGAPGRTERTLGAALLVFVVAITLAFALTTGMAGDSAARSGLARAAKTVLGISDLPLFTVDQSKIPPPVSKELLTAKAMLPEHERVSRDMRLIGLDIKPGEYPPEHLVVAAKAYGARQFVFSGKEEGIEVSILDLGDPGNAFGLWRARRPSDGTSLKIGGGGWRSSKGDQIGFWAGRHFTLLHDSFPKQEPGELEAVARAIAEKQLVFGRPFWSESVLPTEGRVEESLRLVKSDPLGLKLAADCWLADYANGMTIGVIKASPEQREAVLAAAKESLATEAGKPAGEYGEAAKEEEQEGYETEAESKPAGGITDSGSAKARAVTAMPAGEYVFLATGPDAAVVDATLGSLVDRWSAAKAEVIGTATATPPAGSQGPFVDLGDPQILAPIRIERYTDNLYEKINGREPQFRQFGFVDLRVGSYLFVPRQTVYDAYVFDMGEPVNAMGIYMTEKSGSSHSLAIGRDGYASGASVYFWKGKYYVYILGPADTGEEAVAVAERIARAIEKTIDDTQEPFWAEKILPAGDRVPDSLSYRASSGLGFDFLQRMFVASYRTGDKDYQMYIIRADSPQEARTLFDKFAEATAKYDKIVGRSGSATDPNGETVVSESLGVFGAAFHKGVYFGGVAECDDRALAEKRAGELRDSLPGK